MKLRSLILFALLLVSVRSAFGSETFANPRFLSTPGGMPTYLTVGDVNGDGLPDLIWSLSSASPIHVWLAQPGGGFISGVDIPALPSSYGGSVLTEAARCSLGDLNGDGKPDLVCPVGYEFNEYADFMAGNGDGTFKAGVLATLSPPGGTNGSWGIFGIVQFADVDRDGKMDMIALEAVTYSGEVLYGDGAGGIRSVARFANGSQAMPVVDFNHDGMPDFLLPTNGPGMLRANADGSYTSVTTVLKVGGAAYSGAICAYGDVDKDGMDDAVCTFGETIGLSLAGINDLVVVHGNADGTFNPTPISVVKWGTSVSGSDSYAGVGHPLRLADLNGDGYLDVIGVSSTGVFTMMGGAGASFGAPRFYVTPYIGQDTTFNFLYDMNGDGLPDIVSPTPGGISIAYAKSDGSFDTASGYPIAETSSHISVADFNGDGTPDVVSSGDLALGISLGKGDGSFSLFSKLSRGSDNIQFNTPNSAGYALLLHGDFNGDGKQDIISIGSSSIYQYDSYLFLGHGDGTFDDPTKIANSSTIYPAFSGLSDDSVHDLNHDGRSDIATTLNNNIGPPTLLISYGNADGTFRQVTTTLPAEYYGYNNSFVQAVTQPAFADFTHQNQYDLVFATADRLYVAPAKSDGTFDLSSPPLSIPALRTDTTNSSPRVVTGDFDGDGNPDIAVLSLYDSNSAGYPITYHSAVWVFYGNGDGSFSDAVLAGEFRPGYAYLQTADFDNDYRDDLLVCCGSLLDNGQAVAVINSNPDRTFGAEVPYVAGYVPASAAIADVNGDGFKDLLFNNGPTLSVLLNQGSAQNVMGTLLASPEPSVVFAGFHLTVTLTPPGAETLAGPIEFFIDGQSIGSVPLSGNTATIAAPASLAVGTHTLSATWAGDTTYGAVTLRGTHVVTGLALSIALSATPNSAHVTDTVVLSTTFQAESAGSYTGTLTFFDGATQIAQIVPSASGFSTTWSAPLTAGTHTLRAVYAGDAVYGAATSNLVTLVVNRWPSQASLSVSPNVLAYSDTAILSATLADASGTSHGTPTGSVTFVDETSTLGNANVANAVASLAGVSLQAGTRQLSCNYAGDTVFEPSSCAVLPVTVTPAATSITLSASPSPAYVRQSVLLSVAVRTLQGQAASGSVLLYDADTTLLTTLTLDAQGNASWSTSALAVGLHHLTAAYQPTSNFVASSASTDETILDSDFTLTLNPSSVIVSAGNDAVVNVLVGSVGNFSGPVQLSLGVLPSVATASLAPAGVSVPVEGTATSLLTIHTAQRAENKSSPLPGRSSRTLPLLVCAFPLLALLRRRAMRTVLMLMLACGMLVGASGCTHRYYVLTTVSTGGYSVVVTGTDTAGHTHSATFNLQVTP